MDTTRLQELVIGSDSKIILFVCDGLGGIQSGPESKTELEAARTPNMDRLASDNAVGLLDPVFPGIPPGSGPGHLALFGYEPTEFDIGRGVLAALGSGFDLQHSDVAMRLNFATVDAGGKVTDRRAGRIPNDECKRLCEKLSAALQAPKGVEIFLGPVKEHRAYMVLRGKGLSAALHDTDPQQLGVPPLAVKALDERPETAKTGKIVQGLLNQMREILGEEPRANVVLARGFAEHRRFPTLRERFGLRGAAVASYPMYRGVAKLVGMELLPINHGLSEDVKAIGERWDDFDYFFLHFKTPDKMGEDGNFDGKVAAIEEADAVLPEILALKPDVVAISADHSTPSAMKMHSWHPVPLLFAAETVRRDAVQKFDEVSCLAGGLGRQPTVNLLLLMLAHAGRLTKYGA
ncbi:MAG: 2,3-bisphosphoglycerate-independent phosphoglycerate mutase [Phycisphaerae bacterium]|jgi:2,3-bisphosphoglycerate-independent phosphoglycerate mutase|nr:2,3-bisphosphoglycerate-independent phosphoglycerate mutase [Phycisphaerae bacterium]